MECASPAPRHAAVEAHSPQLPHPTPAGRIAYAFGLRGPTASVDTACSASLVAAHLACLGFREGRLEGALAAGVLLCLVPESTLMLSRAGMLSPEGRSKTLDASADGYVRGETCKALYLRPAGASSAAATSAQQPLGLLLGTGVNTNGRASSLTAPNGPAQQALLRETLAAAGARAADVAGLQMHSNGTALGDPIEVGAASAVFLVSRGVDIGLGRLIAWWAHCWRDLGANASLPHTRSLLRTPPESYPSAQEGAQRPRRPFLLATVKGFTGHQESGAGVAGLQAAALLVQAAAVPPALHLRHLNPHVHGALAGHAVSIARGGPYGVPSAAPAAAALTVGVSSFGAQGTNAHALLGGSGAAATIDSAAAGQPAPAWRRSRCYVAPAVQHLLTGCVLRGKRRGGGSITLDSLLSAPRLAYLWQYGLQGRAHLPAAALLSMAASALPLMGAVVPGEDAAGAALVAAVTEASLVAPLALPQAAAARVAPAAARLRLDRASGALEVAVEGQQLMAAKLGSLAAGVLSQPAAAPAGTSLTLRALAARAAAAACGHAAVGASAVAETAHLSAAEASGYALHPALLDVCMGQAASVAAAAGMPLTWLRSAEALLVGAASPTGGALAAACQPADSWHICGASLAAGTAPALALLGAVLGDCELPPASPGPAAARQLAAAAAEAAGAGQQEAAEEGQGVAADHPLLQMPEEERLLHLQAQVRWAGGGQLCV